MHLHEAGRLARRRRLDEGRGPGLHAVPHLAHQIPERSARSGEGSSGLALGLREPYRPVLADLTGQRRPGAVAVDGLDVVLPFQPALAVRDDARGPVERVVVGAPHVAGLAAGNRRIARARPRRIGRVHRPARRTLIARPVVEIRDPPGPDSRRRLQVAHLPAPGCDELVQERRVVLPVLGLVLDQAPLTDGAAEIGEEQDALQANAVR